MTRSLALVAIVLALISLQLVTAQAPQDIAAPSGIAPGDPVDQAIQDLAAWPAGRR